MADGAPLRIDNRTARRLWLARCGLAEPPARKLSRADLLALITRLGFVQIDSINTVERAHHMILFARSQTYRRTDLTRLLEQDRALFENWTHDAAIIPTMFYPYWMRKFERDREKLLGRWRSWRREGFEDLFETVLAKIRDDGPCGARAFENDAPPRQGPKTDGWWDWKPSKSALEYLWRTGRLAVRARRNFNKIYDLAEHVIPKAHRGPAPDAPDFIHWACHSALERLGFGAHGDIAAFWDLVSPAEAKEWCARERARGALIEVEIEPADGSKPRLSYALPELEEEIGAPPEPPGRIRALSPFDPALRDRKRAERLFDFSYRIEVFTPAAKREYGYYVFPLLEGDRMVGRVDMRRDGAVLGVTRIWWEPGVKPGAGRVARLKAELRRVARFAGCAEIRI